MCSSGLPNLFVLPIYDTMRYEEDFKGTLEKACGWRLRGLSGYFYTFYGLGLKLSCDSMYLLLSMTFMFISTVDWPFNVLSVNTNEKRLRCSASWLDLWAFCVFINLKLYQLVSERCLKLEKQIENSNLCTHNESCVLIRSFFYTSPWITLWLFQFSLKAFIWVCFSF